MGVRFGVWWCDTYPSGSHPCKEANLIYTGHAANAFAGAMRTYGHEHLLHFGNDNAWSSDFDHPDYGGHSLDYLENVHFGFFGGHGGNAGFDGKRIQALKFSSVHNPPSLAPCFTMSAQWKLGVKHLKWLLLDSCFMVRTTDAPHVVEVWGPPMRGVHLVMGFIGLQYQGPNTHNRRVSFVDEICRGTPLGTAWLATAFGAENPNTPVNCPIVVAAGVDEADAFRRRDHERLDWIDADIGATNWLAWKWRA